MPRYELSSLGRLFVIDEELQFLPITRQIFAIVTALIGIVTLTRFLLVLSTKTSLSLRLINLRKTIGGRVVLLYMVSHIIHSVHYVDNICRPVAYFEPKWLYQKYFISEMEITFFANFPITLSGLYYMERLVRGINGERCSDTVDACKKMIWFILGSLLTLGHYRTEPPWKYEPFVNFTIAGEGVATILLALSLYQLRKESLRKMNVAMEVDMEQAAGLLDDEQEQNKFGKMFAGVRSRTPVKL